MIIIGPLLAVVLSSLIITEKLGKNNVDYLNVHKHGQKEHVDA